MANFVEVANLAVSVVTAVAAIYLALAALKHTAKPRIKVVWQRPSQGSLRTDTGFDNLFIFDVFNVGHWYSKPPARQLVMEFRCSDVFTHATLRKGGTGGQKESRATGHSCPGPPLVLHSSPVTIFPGEMIKFGVEVGWFGNMSGAGWIEVRASSENGVAYLKEFQFHFENQPAEPRARGAVSK